MSYQLKEARDFSCLLCPLPWDVAEEVRAWGKKNIATEDLINDGLEPNIHVTLKYGLHDNDPFELRELIWNFGRIKMALGRTSIFESDEQDVVKIEVISPRLHVLNKAISDNFDHTDTHPIYLPHTTVAYVRPGSGKKYSGRTDFEGRKMILTEAVFSGNDYRETALPFKP